MVFEHALDCVEGCKQRHSNSGTSSELLGVARCACRLNIGLVKTVCQATG